MARFRREHYTVWLQRDGEPAVPVRAPISSYYADPFVFAHQNQTYLFVEDYRYLEGRGNLACLLLDDALNVVSTSPILRMPSHMSFPFVFKHNDGVYMVPETCERKCVDLFAADGFPGSWKLQRRLLSNVDAADSVIFEKDNLYWLVTSVRDAPGQNRYLQIYFSPDLLTGPFQPHPMNSQRLYAGLRHGSGRNAGPIFTAGDGLFRLSQHSKKYYGQGSRLMQITLLTTEHFAEEPFAGTADVNEIIAKHSPHHISWAGTIHAWDARDRT